MGVIYDTFNIPTPLVAPEIRHSKRESKSMDFILSNQYVEDINKIIQNVNR